MIIVFWLFCFVDRLVWVFIASCSGFDFFGFCGCVSLVWLDFVAGGLAMFTVLVF